MHKSFKDPKDTAHILIEALPYIHRFRDKTVVVKFGGNAMSDSVLLENFARDIVLLHTVGIKPVVVHGGGPQIDAWLQKVGQEGQYIEGLRMTNQPAMEVVEMVLGGQIGKHIVAQMQRHGGLAIGLTGKDGGLIQARKKPPLRIEGKECDLGWVGEVDHIDPSVIVHLSAGGYVPVVSPIGVDAAGNSYNINADTVAGKLAVALAADKLMMLTNTPGILDKNETLLSGVTPLDIDRMIEEGSIYGGMIPKIDAALTASRCGVSRVHIIDGRVKHAILLELFTDLGVGTVIHAQ